MPYKAEKSGSSWKLRNTETNELLPAKHKTKKDAQAAAAAILANEAAGFLPERLVDLKEAAFDEAGFLNICVATPGWGTTGYYSPDVLERDAASAFPAGTHMYLDHPTLTENYDRPERSVRDLAAVTVNDGHWQEAGFAGPGIYTTAQVIGPYRELLTELAPHVGVSMRAPGVAQFGEAEGQSGQLVQRIGKAHSIDFVTKAGRGGQVQTLLESAGVDLDLQESRNLGEWLEARLHNTFTNITDDLFGEGHVTREERITLSSALGAGLKAFSEVVASDAAQLYDRDVWADPAETTPTTIQESDDMDKDKDDKVNLDELRESIAANVKADLEKQFSDELAEARKERDEAKANAERAAGALLIREAQDAARELVGKAEAIPAASRERIVSHALGNELPLTESGTLDREKWTEQVNKAIDAEVTYLQEAGIKLAGSVKGLGETKTEHQESDPTKLADQLGSVFSLDENAAKTAAAIR